jgi:hypothetical protein
MFGTGLADLSAYDGSISLYNELKADGTISEYNYEWKISTLNLPKSEVDYIAGTMENLAEKIRYDLKSHGLDGSLRVDVVHKGDAIILRNRNIKPSIPAEQIGMSFTSYDGKITFEGSLIDPSGGSYTLTLKMPGKVVSSNADQVKGDTAVWFFKNSVNEVWVTSNEPAPGSLSGILAIICLICAAMGFFLWRRP